MPYIPQDRRKPVFGTLTPFNAGELNYLISKLVDRYVESRGASYKVYNEVIGVLECAKLEYYRRRLAPYEDGAVERNGDIY